MKDFHSGMKKEDVLKKLGWDDQQYQRFLRVTKMTRRKLLETNEYWEKVPKPNPLVWDEIPLAVRQEMVDDANKALKHDPNTVVNIQILEWRFRPILLRKSKEIPQSTSADLPVASPPPQQAVAPVANPPPQQAVAPVANPSPQQAVALVAAAPPPTDPPQPAKSQTSRFWDPIAEDWRGG
ncbi:hypothetical protein B0J12DRAFT_685285 [Macrophomina phaseolina]|uniref:Uncharacterized protein n=1 Tax=Macrophomina phaseolina TaxID=35725 RepID=A0ABQ8FTR8_9PEZI|nr:hypothetical protein B0J12DRAFT_685285 [Macrophomina phaseolina]